MEPSFKVISIGALEAHPLWSESREVRTGHATTTLIEAGESRILVDPSLPAQILAARLAERANLGLEDITHIFLTSFQPVRRRAILSFDNAAWLISEREREAIGVNLVANIREAMEGDDRDLISLLKSEIALLERCKPAPDHLAEGVDLFPLPGVTPGTCGLLIATARATILICGDAIPTVEHLTAGKVLQHSADIAQAQASFRDAIEIADLLILGRDNVVLNPLRQPF